MDGQLQMEKINRPDILLHIMKHILYIYGKSKTFSDHCILSLMGSRFGEINCEALRR